MPNAATLLAAALLVFAADASAQFDPKAIQTAMATANGISGRRAEQEAALKRIEVESSPEAEKRLFDQGILLDKTGGSVTLKPKPGTQELEVLSWRHPLTKKASILESDYNGGNFVALIIEDLDGTKHYAYLQDGKVIKRESRTADPDVEVVLGEGTQTVLDNHRVLLNRREGTLTAGGSKMSYKLPGTKRVVFRKDGSDTVTMIVMDNDGGRTYLPIVEGVPGDPLYEKP